MKTRTALLAVLVLACAVAVQASTVSVEAEDHYQAARTLLDTGQTDAALGAIQQAIHVDPQRAPYFELLGRIHLTRLDYPAAQLAFAEATRLDPANATTAALAARLVRKVGIRSYAEGVEAFNAKRWGVARQKLKEALQIGNLPEEHMAIAQQDLIVATFAESRVAEEIARIKEARIADARSYNARRVYPREDARYVGGTTGAGVLVVGRVLERTDDPATRTSVLIVSPERAGAYTRPAYEDDHHVWVRTRALLPDDPRAVRGALVEVNGLQTADGPAGYRLAVNADQLRFDLDRGGRGLAGPLVVDYLSFNAEQRANLPEGEH